MHTSASISTENPLPQKKDALELEGVTLLFQCGKVQQPALHLNAIRKWMAVNSFSANSLKLWQNIVVKETSVY